MKLALNDSGQIDYDQLEEKDTLADLLEAIDVFIEDNPLPCRQCQNGCCRKPWAVEVDNVSVRWLSNLAGISKDEFVDEMLEIKENKYLDFDQYVMKKQTSLCPFVSDFNRCQVYESRPLICRLYTCAPKSPRYNQLREAAAATYLQALVFEQIIRNHNLGPAQLSNLTENPALFSQNYQLSLQKILDYAADEGWI